MVQQTKLLRISKAAAQAGVSRQTVEYYIMLGLLKPLRSPPKPGRYFDASLVRRIRLIRRLNESGYTLSSIREMYSHKLK